MGRLIMVLISIAIGFAGERLLNHRHNDAAVDSPSSKRQLAQPEMAGSPAEKTALTTTRGNHLPQTLVTAYAAVLNNRPLAVLRYLEDPAGLDEIRQLMTIVVEHGGEFPPEGAAADALFARWIELDVRDALEFCNSLRTRFRLRRGGNQDASEVQRQYLIRLYGVWLDMDHAAATAALEKETIPDVKRRTLRNRKDPRGSQAGGDFIAEAQRLAEDPDSVESRRSIYSPIRKWAKSDPEAVLKFASELPPGKMRQTALTAALYSMRKSRPDLVAEFATDQPPSLWRTGHLLSAAEQWGKIDPDACLAWARTLEPGLGADGVMLAVAHAISEKSPQQALAILESRDWRLMGASAAVGERTYYKGGYSSGGASGRGNVERYEVFTKILAGVAKTDPQRALRAAGELDLVLHVHDTRNSIYIRRDLINTILETWIKSDAAAARQFVASMPGATDLSVVRGYGWAGKTPADAAEFAATLEPGKLRNRLVGEIADDIRSEEQLAQLASLPEETRAPIERLALRSIANSDPDAVIRRLDALPAKEARELIPSIISGMRVGNRRSLPEIAEWLSGYPDQSIVANSFDNIASDWLRTDPESTTDWVNSLPPGRSRDSAIGGIVENLIYPALSSGSKQDYELAFEWTSRMNNERTRNQSVERTLLQWHSKEPEKAAQALSNASIPADLRARIESKFRERAEQQKD